MKIFIRYCSEWGNMSTKSCQVSNAIKVLELKKQIQSLTDIPISDQILILGDYTLQDDCYLSQYEPEESQFIYVNRNIDVQQPDDDVPDNTQDFDNYNRRQKVGKFLGIVPEDSDEEDQNHLQSLAFNKPQQEICAEFIKLVKNNDEAAVRAMISNHQTKVFDLINDKQYCGYSGFHYANQYGHENLVKYMLDNGVDINLCTNDGQSSLQLALKNSKIECAKLLLNVSLCDVNYSRSGKSALQLAVQNGELDIIELILKHPTFDHLQVDLYELKGDQQAIDLVTYKIKQRCNQENSPPKPKAQKGYIKKVNIMKFFHYKRYLVLNPEDGNLTRYKVEADCPLQPIETISLINVISVNLPEREWYMKKDHQYLLVQYKCNKSIESLLFCSRSQNTIQNWKQSLQDSITYYKDLDQKMAFFSLKGDLNQINSIIENNQNNYNVIADSRAQTLNEDAANLLKLEANKVAQQKESKQIEQQPTKNTNEEIIKIPQKVSSSLGTHQQYLVNYSIIKQIGQGAFGKVFLVKYNQTQEIYAMKQLNKKKLIAKKQVRFAVSECQILKKVDFPYIVNLFQSFQTPNNLYLVMDYCNGGDLQFHLTKQKKFNEQISKIIIKQVMKAIEYLHSLSILYRDLKPENIIFKNGKIKLVDFGLSKEAEFGITKTFCGSPAYLAPEVLNKRGAVQATDVYGIGTVLYELLIGEPPYFSEDLSTLYANINTQNLLLPNTLSKPCQLILNGLLKREPRSRIGCKLPSQVDWNLIKQHEWLDWDSQDEIIPFANNQENLDSVIRNLSHNLNDQDYTEENEKFNRVHDWSFSRV